MSLSMFRLGSPTLLSLVLLATIAGCPQPGEEGDDEVGETGEQALVIVGSYTDEWGDMHTIGEESWTNAAGLFHIEQFDNDAMYLVAHNDAGNEYFPNLYSRFDWVFSGDDLFYCQSVFDGATLEAALAGSANRDDLMLGCGGFAWTNLTP